MNERTSTLLNYRSKIRQFCVSYSRILTIICRFVCSLIVILQINSYIGYMSVIASVPVSILISVACAFLPWGASAFVIGLVVLAHLYALSPLAMLTGILLIVAMFCCYYIFDPKSAALLSIVAVLFFLRIPCAAPVVIGLMFDGFSVIPMCFGIIMYYFIYWISINEQLLAASSLITASQQITYILTGVLCNPQVIGCMIAFAVTILVVYCVRKISERYGWEAAIIAGSLTCLIIQMALASMLEYSVLLANTIAGIIIGAAVGFLVRFFIFSGDYRSVVQTQFEDDEYYYYVKAVPKVDVHPEEKQLKKFVTTTRKKPVNKSQDRLAVYLGYEPEIDTEVFDDDYAAKTESDKEKDTVSAGKKKTDTSRRSKSGSKASREEVTRVVDMSKGTEEIPKITDDMIDFSVNDLDNGDSDNTR